MSEITKIQVNMFANNTHSISQTNRMSESQFKNEPTINLQDVSPIKPSPHQSEKKRNRNQSEQHCKPEGARENPEQPNRTRIISKA